MIKIEYVFATGFRCNSTQFIREHKLVGVSSPLDWVTVDFETSISNIADGFKNFLNDIVIYGNHINTQLFRPTQPINPIWSELKRAPLTYFNQNISSQDLRFNQNYIPSIHSNHVYEWDRICLFLHHWVENRDYIKIKNRADKFNKIYSEHKDESLLFHITRILNSKDIAAEKQKVHNILKKYGIKSPTFIVLTVSDRAETKIEIEDNVYFYTLPVPSVQEQWKYNAENEISLINHDTVYEVMNKEFTWGEIKQKIS